MANQNMKKRTLRHCESVRLSFHKVSKLLGSFCNESSNVGSQNSFRDR